MNNSNVLNVLADQILEIKKDIKNKESKYEFTAVKKIKNGICYIERYGAELPTTNMSGMSFSVGDKILICVIDNNVSKCVIIGGSDATINGGGTNTYGVLSVDGQTGNIDLTDKYQAKSTFENDTLKVIRDVVKLLPFYSYEKSLEDWNINSEVYRASILSDYQEGVYWTAIIMLPEEVYTFHKDSNGYKIIDTVDGIAFLTWINGDAFLSSYENYCKSKPEIPEGYTENWDN